MTILVRQFALGAGVTGIAGSVLAALVACGGGGASGGTIAPIDTTPKGPTAQQYLNPVIDADFPDPAVMRASDGTYYAYATETTGQRIQVARSSDLVSWTRLADALPSKAAWASGGTNFWAPDVHERNGTFVMYYATQGDSARAATSSAGFCIAMATSSAPTGPFVDVGHPVVCGRGFTTIDAMGFDDPQTGKRYLYWGSDGQAIVVQELSATDRSRFAAGSSPIALVGPRSGNDGSYDVGLIEGPWVSYTAPYYYLFFSGNGCCGAGAHYAVMVARSTSPTGPFEVLRSGSAAQTILSAGGKWTAPGHNSIVRDGAGTDWIVYHAIDVNNPFLIAGRTDISRRPMLIDRVSYVNGWPQVVPNGNPTATPQTRPTP